MQEKKIAKMQSNDSSGKKNYFHYAPLMARHHFLLQHYPEKKINNIGNLAHPTNEQSEETHPLNCSPVHPKFLKYVQPFPFPYSFFPQAFGFY